MDSNMPQAFDELEVRIYSNARTSSTGANTDAESINQAGYHAEIRCPDNKGECELPPVPYATLEQMADPRSYGAALFDWLFRGEVRDIFMRARWGVESYARPGALSGLRLRLWLDDKASQLQTLSWEAMFDPGREEPLSVDIAFSRFVRVRAKRGYAIAERPLRVLLVASPPQGLPEFNFDEVAVALERMSTSGSAQSPKRFLY